MADSTVYGNPNNSRRRRILTWLACGCAVIAATTALWVLGAGLAEPSPLLPPQQVYGQLYKAVESARIFPDDKEFADAVPKSSPAEILSLYRQEAPHSRAALRRFVTAHFMLPPDLLPPVPMKRLPLTGHIDALWPELVRHSVTVPRDGSLLALPYPYVVPGGRFREVYYWDSYFTMLGLMQSGRRDLVVDMVRNFAHLINAYGHIPNGNRSYYISRSQPPFFFAMVSLLNETDPAQAYAQYLPELKREYVFWMQDTQYLTPNSARRRVVAMADGAVLNRYWDDSDQPRDESWRKDQVLALSTTRPAADIYRNIRSAAESGWDFSSRWFVDGKTLKTIATTSIVPIDLNSLLYGLEQAIAQGCERTGDHICAASFHRYAVRRNSAMDRYLWNPAQNTYFDYDWSHKRSTGRLSAATLYPLFIGAAKQQQADLVADIIAKHLLKPGGIVTTETHTGEQWDAPNGWAPLQWIAIGGLARYHHPELAALIACRWTVNVRNNYQQSGKLLEKYDVVILGRPSGGGEYTTQDGFGWTNGVTRKLTVEYPQFSSFNSVKQCPMAIPSLSHDR